MKKLALTLAAAAAVLGLATASNTEAQAGGSLRARLDALEAQVAATQTQLADAQSELGDLRAALDAANLTVITSVQTVRPGNVIGVAAECPAGTTLRGWSYNVTGYVGGVRITSSYPRPDLSGYFVRVDAHGLPGGYVAVYAYCGPEVVE